jgi:hypothetical protein
MKNQIEIVDIQLSELTIIPPTVGWYDYYGLWFQKSTKETVEFQIMKLLKQATGITVTSLEYMSDGNGHLVWKFNEK